MVISTPQSSASEFFNRTIINNPFIMHKPHRLLVCQQHGIRSAEEPLRRAGQAGICECSELICSSPQATFLTLICKEALYGGAAGGGKTDALLMAALQFVEVSGYSALMLRKDYPRLAAAKGLIPRSHEWLSGTKAVYTGTPYPKWKFPSGAQLSFGYLKGRDDKYRYQGAEYHFIGFDELTEFDEPDFKYLFSRLRTVTDPNLPVRMRATSNPGGRGHDWVKARFITKSPESKRIFIPALLQENPSLDPEDYAESLRELDPVDRARLLAGDWDVRIEGNVFKSRSWFKIIPIRIIPIDKIQWVRFWDIAASKEKPGRNPDWTVGALVGNWLGDLIIRDIRRIRDTPLEVEEFIRETAREDGIKIPIYMEQEPGASGVNTIEHYKRRVLFGYSFDGRRPLGKPGSWKPVASAAQMGRVKLIEGHWNQEFLDEAESVRYDMAHNHDDQVDAVAGGYNCLSLPNITELAISWGPTAENKNKETGKPDPDSGPDEPGPGIPFAFA